MLSPLQSSLPRPNRRALPIPVTLMQHRQAASAHAPAEKSEGANTRSIIYQRYQLFRAPARGRGGERRPWRRRLLPRQFRRGASDRTHLPAAPSSCPPAGWWGVSPTVPCIPPHQYGVISYPNPSCLQKGRASPHGKPQYPAPGASLSQRSWTQCPSGGCTTPRAELPPQGKGSRTRGPSNLPPRPGNWSAPNNVNFGINMHFLRQFQRQSSIQWRTPPSQLSLQPGGCTTLLITTPNCSGGRCRALEPQVTPHPASPEGAVSVQGRRKKVSMALHLLGVSGQVLIPKGQNQHPKPKTQPRLQEEDYTRPHSPF